MDVHPIRWTQFRRELMELYEPPLRALATKREMSHALDLVQAHGAITTADLTVGLIARICTSIPPDQAARTTQKHLRYVRVMCNHAVRSGWLNVSPFTIRPLRQWLPRIGPPRPKLWFRADQVRRVLDLMAQDIDRSAGWAQWRARRLYALTSTVALAGLRAGEAQWLHTVDLHLDTRVIAITDRGRVGEKALKTEASAQAVPLCEALVPILRDWLKHRLDAPADFPIPPCEWVFPNCNRRGPWRDGALGTKPVERLQQVAARAGVPGMTFQSLRASWATAAQNAGYSGLIIQRVLRHSNPTTQLWYRGDDIEALTRTVADFTYG